MWVGKWPNYFWWGGIGQGEIKFSGGGSELKNPFKCDLKSNQNQFLKYDFHPIKIIFLKLILNQNQNHEKIDCNQFKSLT